jgi:toxin ParE1/3/4
MNRPVFWSERASDAVEVSVAVIARDNPAAAQRVAKRLYEAAEKLGERSIGRMGRVQETYEKTVVGLPYIICYTIDALPNGTERIVILHVIHTARHWPSATLPH